MSASSRAASAPHACSPPAFPTAAADLVDNLAQPLSPTWFTHLPLASSPAGIGPHQTASPASLNHTCRPSPSSAALLAGQAQLPAVHFYPAHALATPPLASLSSPGYRQPQNLPLSALSASLGPQAASPLAPLSPPAFSFATAPGPRQTPSPLAPLSDPLDPLPFSASPARRNSASCSTYSSAAASSSSSAAAAAAAAAMPPRRARNRIQPDASLAPLPWQAQHDNPAAQLTCASGPVFSHIFCRIDKGVALEGDKYVAYRRNYFQATTAFTLKPDCHQQPIFVNGKQVQSFGIWVACYRVNDDGSSGDRVEVVQYSAKREQASRRTMKRVKILPGLPLPHPPDPREIEPFRELQHSAASLQYSPDLPSHLYADLDDDDGSPLPIATRCYIDSVPLVIHGTSSAEKQHTFERCQFKVATMNNGKRKAKQQFYHLVVELFADVRVPGSCTPIWQRLASRASERLIVRGRSPHHYVRGSRCDDDNLDTARSAAYHRLPRTNPPAPIRQPRSIQRHLRRDSVTGHSACGTAAGSHRSHPPIPELPDMDLDLDDSSDLSPLSTSVSGPDSLPRLPDDGHGSAGVYQGEDDAAYGKEPMPAVDDGFRPFKPGAYAGSDTSPTAWTFSASRHHVLDDSLLEGLQDLTQIRSANPLFGHCFMHPLPPHQLDPEEQRQRHRQRHHHHHHHQPQLYARSFQPFASPAGWHPFDADVTAQPMYLDLWDDSTGGHSVNGRTM